MKYVIFDIDNCISDDSARIPLIDWNASNVSDRYARYHAACGDDEPGNRAAFALATHAAVPVFLTARPVAVRAQTLDWLRRHFFVQDPILLMRNNGDHRPSPSLKLWQFGMLTEHGVAHEDIIGAFDDRLDVVYAYQSRGITAVQLAIHDVCAYTRPKPASADKILASMAKTFAERNAQYRDNFKMVPQMVRVLFPDGVPSELVTTDQWHLFELKLVKLTRFAVSGLTHLDSIHDDAVYSAMIEAILLNEKE